MCGKDELLGTGCYVGSWFGRDELLGTGLGGGGVGARGRGRCYVGWGCRAGEVGMSG